MSGREGIFFSLPPSLLRRLDTPKLKFKPRQRFFKRIDYPLLSPFFNSGKGFYRFDVTHVGERKKKMKIIFVSFVIRSDDLFAAGGNLFYGSL